MRFLDVCKNPFNPPGGSAPFLLIVQGDYVPFRSPMPSPSLSWKLRG